MASDRGGQVLALLDRLARYALDRTRLPRRVGLSATLGDYNEAAMWLNGTSGLGVDVISEEGGRTVFLLVDHFTVRAEQKKRAVEPEEHSAAQEEPAPREPAVEGNGEPEAALADELIARQEDLFRATYDATQKRKSLIFTNSRADAEEIITGLRRLAEREHMPDIYFVHHGSIAAALRESAETAMRDGEGPACTAATVTLELGIDLGQLDRVLQLGPTFSVASFLQRLGRAGRRGQRPEMFFLLREDEPDNKTPLLDRVPWELIQAIATIQIYAEEKWIEPLARAHLPGSLLYHQTMSIVGAAGELTPPQLAERVLTLAPFRGVPQDDFRALLRHMLELDHLQRTEEGGLILGLEGGSIVHHYKFLATFQDTSEWAVKEGTRDIGTIPSPVPAGERFALAGRIWEVVEIVADQRVLVVRRVKGSLKTHFIGGHGGDVHRRIVERMRRVLEEDIVYPYITERAAARLAEARQIARHSGIAAGPTLVPLSREKVAIVPWAGSRALRTLALRVTQAGFATMTRDGFYLTLTAVQGGVEEIANGLAALAQEEWDAEAMASDLDRAFCIQAKFDEFLPDELLRKSFAAAYLDAEEAAERLRATVDLEARVLGVRVYLRP
jgi:ATP-dependent Lhr-like helicase